MPRGCQNGAAGDSGWKLKRSSSRPSLRWSRFFASARAPQVAVEVLLGLPDGAVDALQHRSLLVAAPVGGGGAEELEGTDPGGRLEVRPAAQVDEVTVAIEADHLAGRQLADDLRLVRLPRRGLAGHRLVASELAPLERQVGGHLRTHALLDRLQVGRRQGARQVEVVVEAVADGRTDPQLGLRKELEDGRRHDMRRRMAHRVEPVVSARIEQLFGA